MGLTYKKNIGDFRNSPAIKILNKLKNSKIKINVFEPYLKHQLKRKLLNSNNIKIINNIRNINNINNFFVLLVNHDIFNLQKKLINTKNFYDTTNELQ